MRKFFAWIEITAAVVLAVSAVVGYVRVQFDSTAKLFEELTDTIRQYQQVTKNGKIIADSTLKTVPRWRETLASAKVCVANIKTASDDSSRKISSYTEWKYLPKSVKDYFLPLKENMQVFSDHCEKVNDNLAAYIETIDKNLSPEQCVQIVQAFDQTLTSLEAAEKSVSCIQQDIKTYSLIILIILLAMSVCFFANGMICILDTKKAL